MLDDLCRFSPSKGLTLWCGQGYHSCSGLHDGPGVSDHGSHRTPVIVPPQRIGAWLDPELTDKHAALELINGIEHEPLQVRAVSTAVNKTGRGGSRGPELIKPIGEHGDQPLQLAPA